MKKLFAALVAIICFAAATAQAITLSLSPMTQSVTSGSLLRDLTISGINMGTPQLGAWHLNISFNPSILSFSSGTFGTNLDLFDIIDPPVAASGNNVTATLEPRSATITKVSSVPKSNTVWLLGFGLIGLICAARKSRTRNYPYTAERLSIVSPRLRRKTRSGALVGLTVLVVTSSAHANGVAFNPGDVSTRVGNGLVKHFSPDTTLLDTLKTGTGSTTTTIKKDRKDDAKDIHEIEVDKNDVEKDLENIENDKSQIVKDRAAHNQKAVEEDQNKLAKDRAQLNTDMRERDRNRAELKKDRPDLYK